jgi:hypothetical protein
MKFSVGNSTQRLVLSISVAVFMVLLFARPAHGDSIPKVGKRAT